MLRGNNKRRASRTGPVMARRARREESRGISHGASAEGIAKIIALDLTARRMCAIFVAHQLPPRREDLLMSDLSNLSRRERQIMEIVHSRERVTVNEIRAALPEPPTPMAVRRMVAILTDKGFLNRTRRGREAVYSPRQSQRRAGLTALRHVLSTYFQGSVGNALATHFEKPGATLTDDELDRLTRLIEDLSQKRSGS
jgi:BlaI family transcriptional regulator, penicillinase repressor